MMLSQFCNKCLTISKADVSREVHVYVYICEQKQASVCELSRERGMRV